MHRSGQRLFLLLCRRILRGWREQSLRMRPRQWWVEWLVVLVRLFRLVWRWHSISITKLYQPQPQHLRLGLSWCIQRESGLQHPAVHATQKV
jgi:hypothetical protein